MRQICSNQVVEIDDDKKKGEGAESMVQDIMIEQIFLLGDIVKLGWAQSLQCSFLTFSSADRRQLAGDGHSMGYGSVKQNTCRLRHHWSARLLC